MFILFVFAELQELLLVPVALLPAAGYRVLHALRLGQEGERSVTSQEPRRLR